MFKPALRDFLYWILGGLTAVVLLVASAAAQSAAPQPITSEQVSLFEAAVDLRRKAADVPGAAIALVQGQNVLLLKGYGLASVETKAMVTPDTMFQIASASKAFTGLAALIMAEDGKLNLEDRPHKFLPDFRIGDADIDAKITLRDLLSHASGFPRTDVAWIMGKNLVRADLVKGIAQLKPTAKLRQRFQYQNLMYVVAGEVIGAADQSTFEHVLQRRIFDPLGMRNTNVQTKRAATYRDRASGYIVDAQQPPKLTPSIDPEVINAAGGINSTARDLAQWLKFLVARGAIDGRPLVKPDTFEAFTEPVMKVDENLSYALGWFIDRGEKTLLVEHGGNLDGFTSQVAFIPALGVGIAVLTNANNSSFPAEVAKMAIRVFMGGKEVAPLPPLKSPTPQASTPLSEPGVYMAGGPGKDITVSLTSGQLVMSVPGQPPYPLEPMGGRRYRLGGAPDGFFATFRPGTNKPAWSEVFVEQPHGNFVATRRQRAALDEEHRAASEMLGVYNIRIGGKSQRLDIEGIAGQPALLMAGFAALPLTAKDKTTFAIDGLAAAAALTFKQGEDGLISGFTMRNGSTVTEATGPLVVAADITLDQLAAKVLAASGGADRLAGIKTLRFETEKIMTGNGQGVVDQDVVAVTAGASLCMDTTTTTFGKLAGTMRVVARANDGFTQRNNEPAQPLDPEARALTMLEVYFDEPARWATLYKTVKLKGIARRAAGRVYLVDKTHISGAFISAAYDAESYRLVEQTIFTGPKGNRTKVVARLSDYRSVDGVEFPFASTTLLSDGSRQAITMKKVEVNASLDPAACQPLK
jgi:CubicO group peptidase (beta-lactamase class C family)